MKVYCTTCRDRHEESDREMIQDKKCAYTLNSCCPKCGGKVWIGVLAKPIGRRTLANTIAEWRESYNATLDRTRDQARPVDGMVDQNSEGT